MDKETPVTPKQRAMKRTYQAANLLLPLDESKKLAQKTGWLTGALNIAIPIAETLKIAQITARPWISMADRIRHIHQGKKDQEAALPSLNWEEAVKASGQTPAQLDKRFLTQKRIWRFVLFAPVMLVLALMALLLINISQLPLIIWLKVSVFFMALLSVSARGFTQVLICEYRRWQLREQRVSNAEGGEFRCFLTETAWIKATLDMKVITRIFSLIVLGLYSLSGSAADGVDFDSISSAAKRSGDLSRQALVMIFGDVVNNPLSPTNTSMIGELFFVLNSIIATIAMFWFLSVTLRQTVRAGNQGQVFSSGRTMMFPVTTLAGFITLVPTPSGWSISQLVVLWAASIMGVGSANMLTDRAADMLQGGKSLVMQPIAPQTLSASRAIFEMNLCMYGINDELHTMYSESGDAGTKLMSINSLNDGYEISNGSAQCGSARLPVTQKSSSWIPLFDVPVNVEPLIAAQKNALNQMQNRLSQSAYNFVSEFRQKQRSGEGNIADVESEVQEAARQYEETVSQAAQAMDNESSLQDLVAQQLKQYGWLALGSWYQTFATANSKTNAVVTMSPTVSGISGLGEIGAGSLYNQLAMAYRAQLQNNTYSAPLGTQKSKDTQLVSNATDSSAVLVSMTNSWGQDLINKIANINFGSNNDSSDQVNPLLKMKAIGDYTLVGAQTVFTVYTGAKALLYWSKGNNVGAIGAKVVNGLSGAGDIAEGILDAISPVVYFLLFILFSIGFSLSIYLPFIPFIYWISAATNWVVGVIVGAMSGSLWSATHLGSEEDKGSRSAYGYIFLIDVMLRPMLMVFGFFFASLVIVAIGTLLNLLLASAIANVQADSITGLVSIVGILMIYARICTTLVSRAFSLQVTMPDYVISWLGGREGASMLNGMADSVKNMFAGFGSGSGRTPNAKKIVASAGEGNNDNGVK